MHGGERLLSRATPTTALPPADPFVAQLAELCRAEPTAVKWILVPGHAVGHALAERLVLGGTDWANLRFATPIELALEMAAPFLVERGVEPAPEGVGPALVMRLLLELPAEVPAYFRPLGDQPRMAEALWATVTELRLAGVPATALPPAAFDDARKAAELRALLAAYEARLAADRLADRADVLRAALAHVDVGPVLAGDVRLELPGVIWTPLERALLDALPGRRLAARALALPGLAPPPRLARLGAPVEAVAPAPRSDAERLALLMAPAGPPRADGTLAMFQAGGADAEVEEVFRRVLAAGAPLDHVEIACAGARQVALVWEKAQRHGWPVTAGPGVPVTLTRPARALLAFCDWVETGFSAGRLRRLLQSGDVRVAAAEGDGEAGLTPGQAARLLARTEATWGRATYAAALERLAAEDRGRAADPERDPGAREAAAARAAQAGRLAAWIARLLDLVPEAEAPLGRWLDGALAFVRGFARTASELDGEAAVALAEALEELRVLAPLRRAPREALAVLRGRVEGLAVGHDRARPGALHVTRLGAAGYAGRPRTFVVGLEEGGVFPPLLEDPVLLDAERARLDAALGGRAALRSSGDRVSEAVHQAVARLAVLGGHVCLSFSCRDLREYRASFPSWLLLQAARVLEPARAWRYEDLAGRLGEPASAVPADAGGALGEAGWWLAHLRAVGPAGAGAVAAAHPALARGAAAEAARDSDAFTEHDGLVPEAAAALDPRRSREAVSPTALEDLARCPFRFFLRRGLRLEPVDAREPDPDVWLDPLTRGSLLHDLYARFWRELRARGERPDPGRHRARLHALGEEALEAHRALVPPPSDAVHARERALFLEDLDLFLRFEAEDKGREPLGFEVGFGGEVQGEPLARREPVAVDLGPDLRFALRGRIDRIDRLADGRYDAVDYKTGRALLPGGLGATFAGGRQLQHALYALAAAELLRARDPAARVHGSYYFPTRRGQRSRETREGVTREALAAVLRDLFGVLAAGAFVHAPDEEECRFCEFDRACGASPAERAQAKLANPEAAALEAYRRLGGHA